MGRANVELPHQVARDEAGRSAGASTEGSARHAADVGEAARGTARPPERVGTTQPATQAAEPVERWQCPHCRRVLHAAGDELTAAAVRHSFKCPTIGHRILQAHAAVLRQP